MLDFFSHFYYFQESMREFQEWFSGTKEAAKKSSDRTGDSKVLEAKLHDLQVQKLEGSTFSSSPYGTQVPSGQT